MCESGYAQLLSDKNKKLSRKPKYTNNRLYFFRTKETELSTDGQEFSNFIYMKVSYMPIITVMCLKP